MRCLYSYSATILKAWHDATPGGAFFHDGSGANTIRLSYSLSEPDQINEGIRRLAAVP